MRIILAIALLLWSLAWRTDGERSTARCEFCRVGNETSDNTECCLKCDCDLGRCMVVRETHTAPIKECVTQSINTVQMSAKEDQNHTVIEKYAFVHGYMMVTSCKPGMFDRRCKYYDASILLENTPHTDPYTGIMYRNVFCAACNEARASQAWQRYLVCTSTEIEQVFEQFFPNSLDNLFSAGVSSNDLPCGVHFEKPPVVNGDFEICFASVESNKSMKCADNWSNDTCSRLEGPVLIGETNVNVNHAKFYPDGHCLQCSSASQGAANPCGVEVRTELRGNHLQEAFIVELGRSDQSKVLKPWAQTDKTDSSLIPSSVKCDYSHVYDPYQEVCRQWSCPWGRELVGEQCVPVVKDILKGTFNIHLKVRPVGSLDDVLKLHNASIVADELLNALFQDNNVDTELVMVTRRENQTYLMIAALLNISQSSLDIHPIFQRSFYGKVLVFTIHNDSFTFKVDLTHDFRLHFVAGYINISNSFVYSSNLEEFEALDTLYAGKFDSVYRFYKYPGINGLFFCTQILLSYNEVRYYEDLIIVKASAVRINFPAFEHIGNSFRVCLSDYLKMVDEHFTYPELPLFTPQGILSTICNLLSMVGLILTIITYIIFDELRSIPGKNNIMLAVHLLVAEALFQFGISETDNKDVCIVMGILIHFFWLTAIYWMNACTLHMFRTFVTRRTTRSKKTCEPDICIYSLYCYSVAICMVVVNIVVTLYQTEGKKIGYGGRVCYITDPKMVGYVFALPVGVVIILNIVFFFAVVYQISVSTMRRDRGKSIDRDNTIIYMKLSSLTGVTWIFGYLFIWTRFEPLEYVFIVLNAGQGVLIFVSFICTERILKLYREGYETFRVKYCCQDASAVESKTMSMSISSMKASRSQALTRFSDLYAHSITEGDTHDVSVNPSTNVSNGVHHDKEAKVQSIMKAVENAPTTDDIVLRTVNANKF